MVAQEAVILALRELVVLALLAAVVIWIAFRLRSEDRRATGGPRGARRSRRR